MVGPRMGAAGWDRGAAGERREWGAEGTLGRGGAGKG